MAKKEKAIAQESITEDVKNSTVVLNDNTSDNEANCPVHNDTACECEPGHCPNKNCKDGKYWTVATKTDKYQYHFDENFATIEQIDTNPDADHRQANPSYEEKKDTEPTPTPNPDDDKKDDTPSSDECPNDLEEPWAHDKVGELREELHLHTGSNYDVVDAWIEDIKNEQDADTKAAKIAHVAWHIPTGGHHAIKAHHKDLIVAELKKL